MLSSVGLGIYLSHLTIGLLVIAIPVLAVVMYEGF